MSEQYFKSLMQKLPSACVIDIVAPTFAGIGSATPNSDGSFTVSYAAATDLTSPITYQIYVLPGNVNAATLFAATPCDSPRSLTKKVYIDSNGNAFVKGQQYTLGVRARDGVGNIDSNVVLLTSTAIGTANLADVLQTIATDLAASEKAITAAADAIGGGVDVEADLDPEADIEADIDPEVNIETDC